MTLAIQDLQVTLSKKNIIPNLSVSMKTNQFIGIIGANGSGKSTLLKTLYKSITPKGGFISFKETDVLATSPKEMAKRFGVVGQFNDLSFDFTVFQMVMLGRTPHKKLLESDSTEDIEIVEKALLNMGLMDFRDESFLSLSGGEKQRVILARALTQQPEFLILDEPTNHLDIRYQIELMTSIQNLNIGVLAALHDLELAATYCDYIYAMKDGQLIAEGIPEELFTESLVSELYGVKCKLYQNPVTDKIAFHYYL